MHILDMIVLWWRDLFRRRRVSLFNTRDHREEWYSHTSPANLVMAFGGTLLMMFLLVLVFAGYTPILNILPNYRSESQKSRELIVSNIVRIDSMERIINDMMLYTDNIGIIMSGKTPLIKESLLVDTLKLTNKLIMPNGADSILRAQMEGAGRYNLREASFNSGEILTSPVDGAITRKFDITKGLYGVELATADGRVMASQKGTVTLSQWVSNRGYIVQIMHPNNTISIYRNLDSAFVRCGDSVNGGEVIGHKDQETLVSGGASRPIEFELWRDGLAIDPERVVNF